jgi:hypothetical protein
MGAPPRSRAREVALRVALWLALGGWLGSWACFGLVVAPAAFRLLPSTEVAGQLVGPVIAALHRYGIAAGLLLAALAWALGRARWLVWLPLVLAAATAWSELVITPAIAEIRPLAFGPEGSPESAARFGRLHGASMAIFVCVGFATLLLAAAHARADAPAGEGDRP